MKKISLRKGLFIAAAVLLVVGGLFLSYRYLGKKETRYRTEKVTRGDIAAVVTATGKVDAVTTVIVGAQLSGMIKELYVDYNSVVKKGQLLARIDPTIYAAQVDQARANLLLARANHEKAKAQLQDARRTLKRNEQLVAKNFIAQSDVDTARTNVETAEAQVAAAQAQVGQAEAALRQAETNLRYTRILSPVDGVVISRNVDIGQTVAASFQTPTLFSIAQDLTNMQVITSVDEADIGRVRPGQAVTFTVDAYPNQVFKGRIHDIRNAPVTVQNVVTYEVIVRVDNRQNLLKPGMTANVSIVTDIREGVLRVPNSALRFRPDDRGSKGADQQAQRVEKGQGVWVLAGGKMKRVSVKTGISDGSFTEIREGDLREGDLVITEAMGRDNKATQRQAPPPFIR